MTTADEATAALHAAAPLSARLPRPIREFLSTEAAGAVALFAATVVAPLAPRAARMGRSRTLAFARSSSAIRRTPSASSPMRGTPSSTATVAGVTPVSRKMLSNSSAAAWLRGRGRPWLMMVDSRATTGRPAASAAATSSERRMLVTEQG